MIGIIVTGHGLFAHGIQKAVERIIGEQVQAAYVDFPIDSSTDILEEQLKQAIEEVNDNDGVVFFTDLLGGTPFRTASLLSQSYNDIEVLTGINLQMTIEMMLERDGQDMTITEFREQALICGHLGLTSLYDQLQKKQGQQEVESDDGI